MVGIDFEEVSLDYDCNSPGGALVRYTLMTCIDSVVCFLLLDVFDFVYIV
jgi:hypothetical protein